MEFGNQNQPCRTEINPITNKGKGRPEQEVESKPPTPSKAEQQGHDTNRQIILHSGLSTPESRKQQGSPRRGGSSHPASQQPACITDEGECYDGLENVLQTGKNQAWNRGKEKNRDNDAQNVGAWKRFREGLKDPPQGDHQQGGEEDVQNQRSNIVNPKHEVGCRKEEGPERGGGTGCEQIGRYPPHTVPDEVLRYRHMDVGVIQRIHEVPLVQFEGLKEERGNSAPKQKDCRQNGPESLEPASHRVCTLSHVPPTTDHFLLHEMKGLIIPR